MDDAIAGGASRAHLVRMLLLVLGTVAGLLVLGSLFGASSASADDGHDGPTAGSLLGGVVSAMTDTVAEPALDVGETASHAVAPVSHALAPVSHAVPPVTHPVAAVVTRLPATEPVASVLDPVVHLLDGTLAVEGGPALSGEVPWPVAAGAASADPPAGAAVAAVTGTVTMPDPVVRGSALGSLFDPGPAAPLDEFVSAASAGGAMAAALVMLMTPALLVRRRLPLLDPAAPGSPASDTDSSPD